MPVATSSSGALFRARSRRLSAAEERRGDEGARRAAAGPRLRRRRARAGSGPASSGRHRAGRAFAGGLAEGEREDPPASSRPRATRAGKPPAAHHGDAVAHAEDLGHLGGDHQDRHALRRPARRSARWISALAPTSTPWVGSSRISTAGSGREPAAQGDLLLVAAGERRHRGEERGVLMPSRRTYVDRERPARVADVEAPSGATRRSSEASVMFASIGISRITPCRRRSSGT